MGNFHVEAGNFCSRSYVIFTKLVQNITEEARKLEVVNLKKSGRCIQTVCTYFSNKIFNNSYSSIVTTFTYWYLRRQC